MSDLPEDFGRLNGEWTYPVPSCVCVLPVLVVAIRLEEAADELEDEAVPDVAAVDDVVDEADDADWTEETAWLDTDVWLCADARETEADCALTGQDEYVKRMAAVRKTDAAFLKNLTNNTLTFPIFRISSSVQKRPYNKVIDRLCDELNTQD